jgi:hypothetical protein
MNFGAWWETIRAKNQAGFAAYWAIAEQEYRAGNKRVLLGTIAWCCALGIPVPPWAGMALFKIYNKPPKSWDDEFGPPGPKGKSATAVQRHGKIALPLIIDIEEAGRPIGEELFRQVGKKHGVSGGTAKRIYYENVNTFEFLFGYLLHKVREQIDHPFTNVDEIATWFQQNEQQLISFARDFSQNRKRLRSERRAHK